jgi:hypothetical protein
MNVELSVYEYLCATEIFVINGVKANPMDFGEQFDRDGRYGCACTNMKFTRNPPTKEILTRYSITKDEYSKICDALETKLSFGNCQYCC